jgi:ATP-dependent RNA helicase SUPV3L1/SUV3
MIEGLGILDRAATVEDVKALDQDARSALRKHGVRFGQFSIFIPLLLKPAPTRLRLVLWSLASGLQEFPEAPPPGLVTIPTDDNLPAGFYLKSGYRAAGVRALRVDMVERLADMLRTQNTRDGFEANSDMLSITGMTLEQFCNLMNGLGYHSEKGERIKIKTVPINAADNSIEREVAVEVGLAAGSLAIPNSDGDTTLLTLNDKLDKNSNIIADRHLDPVLEVSNDVIQSSEGAETEVFYTFTWGKRSRERRVTLGHKQYRPSNKKRGKAAGGKGNKGHSKNNKAEVIKTAFPKKEKPIDPDNPFAAALKGFAQN